MSCSFNSLLVNHEGTSLNRGVLFSWDDTLMVTTLSHKPTGLLLTGESGRTSVVNGADGIGNKSKV